MCTCANCMVLLIGNFFNLVVHIRLNNIAHMHQNIGFLYFGDFVLNRQINYTANIYTFTVNMN